MSEEIETHREQIAGLCRRYGVKRLQLFGSAARGKLVEQDPADEAAEKLLERIAVEN